MNDEKDYSNLLSRRSFVGSVAAAAGIMIVPRHVLGGQGFTPPSDQLTKAIIGVGGMGRGHIRYEGTRLLADRAIAGFAVNEERLKGALEKNPILVTALNPICGYDNAAKIAKHAYKNNTTLREAAVELGILTAEQFDEAIKPEEMVGPLKL